MQHISIPKPMDAGNSPYYAEKTGILFQQPQKQKSFGKFKESLRDIFLKDYS